jgi:hypothetical protein
VYAKVAPEDPVSDDPPLPLPLDEVPEDPLPLDEVLEAVV